MTTPRIAIPHGSGFAEVGDRCWVARYEFLDVNVGVVAGERGLVVVDTHASEADARRVLDQLRRLGRGEVVAVVTTHEHFDHTLGNAVFRDAYGPVPVHAHEVAAARVAEAAERAKREYGARPDDRHGADVAASRVVVPDRTFSSARVLDLGDRIVEVVHLGRGHTGGDAVVAVPDADLLYAGDLVEESGVPGFGDDCFPLEWPETLDRMVGMLSGGSVVVPGHGLPVGREFVMDQRASISAVAEGIRELAARGVPAGGMGAEAAWPYPPELLEQAFLRGVAQLPRAGRSLPLL